ncbi:Neurogenic locus notch protein 2, partial [Galemys pyrenaicus]
AIRFATLDVIHFALQPPKQPDHHCRPENCSESGDSPRPQHRRRAGPTVEALTTEALTTEAQTPRGEGSSGFRHPPSRAPFHPGLTCCEAAGRGPWRHLTSTAATSRLCFPSSQVSCCGEILAGSLLTSLISGPPPFLGDCHPLMKHTVPLAETGPSSGPAAPTGGWSNQETSLARGRPGAGAGGRPRVGLKVVWEAEGAGSPETSFPSSKKENRHQYCVGFGGLYLVSQRTAQSCMEGGPEVSSCPPVLTLVFRDTLHLTLNHLNTTPKARQSPTGATVAAGGGSLIFREAVHALYTERPQLSRCRVFVLSGVQRRRVLDLDGPCPAAHTAPCPRPARPSQSNAVARASNRGPAGWPRPAPWSPPAHGQGVGSALSPEPGTHAGRDGGPPGSQPGASMAGLNGVCPEGFLGEYCQHRDPCEKSRCQNGGTCVAQAMLGKASCRCAPGFTGDDCQHSTSHPCFVSRPCLNGGTCHVLSRDTYTCTCQVGFTGAVPAGPLASVGGREGALGSWGIEDCFSSGGFGVGCRRITRWTGRGPHRSSLRGLGAWVGPAPHPELVETAGLGFMVGPPPLCSSEPLQSLGAPAQRLEAALTGASCRKQSSEMVRKLCQWSDACLSQPCANGSTCSTAANQFSCKCPAGLTGQTCEADVNECGVLGQCQHGGTCLNLPGSFQCQCPQGFTGQRCDSPYVPCAPSPCVNGGTCRQTGDFSFECNCLPGASRCPARPQVEGVAPLLQDASSQQGKGKAGSVLRPCLGEGRVSPPCETSRFEGPTCERNIDDCPNHRCQNGGVCVDGVNTYNCRCPPQWTGEGCRKGGVPGHRRSAAWPRAPVLYAAFARTGLSGRWQGLYLPVRTGPAGRAGPRVRAGLPGLGPDQSCPAPGQFCTEDVDECLLQPNACQNGGTCTNRNGAYGCVCVNGWSGDDCSENIDDCAFASCTAGSTCIDRVASFSCMCPEGKAGLLCHLDDACISNPCHKGALCDTNPLNGQYICTCPQGYRGADCTEDVDECAMANSNPCEHAGKCVNTDGAFHCECLRGYAGPRCEMDINECHSDPCQNDATCLDKIGGFTCLCMPGTGHAEGSAAPGRAGPREPADVRSGGGSRAPLVWSAPGFQGVHCELEINECQSNPCVNNGQCVDKVNRFHCLCPPGFTGSVCQIDIDDCSSTPCLNGAKCIDHPNGYECQCATGFTGVLCEENVDNCDPDPCHHGRCQDGIDSYTCVCNPGYVGAICSDQIDECYSGPCLHEGRCIDLVNGYQCNCQPGTSGQPRPLPLLLSRSCSEAPPGFVLAGAGLETGVHPRVLPRPRGGPASRPEPQARPAQPRRLAARRETREGAVQRAASAAHAGPCWWSVSAGVNCEINFDDCASNPCVNGACLDGVNRYSCVCSPGFTGPRCNIDIDECASSPCRKGATCVNDVNGFRCLCPEGPLHPSCYSQVDECLSNPCIHGNCTGGLSGYKCLCDAGWAGANCDVDRDECLSDPCQNGGTCDDLVNGYRCACKKGFKGLNCQVNIDECASNPCLNQGTCFDGISGYTCRCALPYTGHNCQIVLAPCSPNPCENAAVCKEAPDFESYTCLCAPGWQGPRCTVDVDECVSSPCMNRGLCHNSQGSYMCECPPGFSGPDCEEDVDDCLASECRRLAGVGPLLRRVLAVGSWAEDLSVSAAIPQRSVRAAQTSTRAHGPWRGCTRPQLRPLPGRAGLTLAPRPDPCQNGGSCVDGVNAFSCLCLPGFVGDRCQTDMDECLSGPCKNGGTCSDYVDSYTCKCQAGFGGVRCEHNIDECTESSCFNGGTCVDGVNAFSCLCPVGFTGPFCLHEVNECSSQPCLNDGVCVDGLGTYRCACPVGYTGKNCQTLVNLCSRSPCKNKGTCVQEKAESRCLCPSGWAGAYCDVPNVSCEVAASRRGERGPPAPGLRVVLGAGRAGRAGRPGEKESGVRGARSGAPKGTCQAQSSGAWCVGRFGSTQVCARVGLPGGARRLGLSGVSRPPGVPVDRLCQHSGVCISAGHSHRCQCPLGYTGSYCEEQLDECASGPCQHGATCSGFVGGYRCECAPGYQGVNCEYEVDECQHRPCQNGGTCIDLVNHFKCSCPPGTLGETRGLLSERSPCARPGLDVRAGEPGLSRASALQWSPHASVPSPRPLPSDSVSVRSRSAEAARRGRVSSAGQRRPALPSLRLSSRPAGLLCEENVDDCAGGPHCLNGGQCVDRIGGYSCRCLPGFAGDRCEGDINECLSSPCSTEGSLDCIQLTDDYQCVCRSAFTGECAGPGRLGRRLQAAVPLRRSQGDAAGAAELNNGPVFLGRHCETFIDVCPQKPCLNGGTCAVASNMPDGFICRCPPGFSGARCQSSCGQVKCRRGEQCVHTASGPRCFCPNPKDCESGCASGPCQHGGSCSPQRQPPYYSCRCPPPFGGARCELYAAPTRTPAAACLSQYCADRARDGVCDEACNSHACQWDGGDCSLTVEDPWANCSSPLPCWDHINGQCDEQCNTAECLFDNFECQGSSRTCKYDKYCADHFGDHRCDQGCNSEECGWDGLDCAADRPENLAEGALVIVVLLPPEQLLQDARGFLRALGSLLRTSLRIKRDPQGGLMVYPYYGEKPAAGKRLRMARRSLPGTGQEPEQEVAGSRVFLEIDNRQCVQDSDQCFKTTDAAAALLASHAIQGTLSYPLVSVVSESLSPRPTQLLYLLAVAVLIILFIVLLGVIMAKRKRKHGSLWLPEGFTLRRDASNHKRREPVGQDAVGLKNLSVQVSEANLICSGTSEHWVDDEGPQPKKTKAEDEALLSEDDDPVDRRPWTQQHLEAADIRRTPSLALTPPQAEQEVDVLDVNVRGPDGCTPLMLASLRGGSSDLSDADEDAEDSAANIITDLVYQGASLQAQTDRTGEMALHLAARYSRADAAKRLLDAGADANAQDNMGRCPLHAAVAADAQGVFQILIRNRVTDLDARMHDGTTPLILAARLAVEGMVAELINCQADVNAVDDHGKSALHWAAAVNNVEATLLLLKNGANRDMQDNKEETPLFLAAREGSYEAAKILLDHFANRDITDHMDRLPRDVARDRMHHDIVRLLDEHNVTPSPPGTVLPPALSPVICGPSRSFLSLKHTPVGKKPRRPSAKSTVPTSLPNLAKEAKEAKGGRRKKSLSDKGQLSESSVTLSPVDSLESPHTYVSDATSSPMITSPGLLQASPNPLLAAAAPPAPVHAQHGLSFSSLREMQPLAHGAGPVLPSVSQLLSPHHLVPPGSGSLGGLGGLHPVTVPADWMNRVEVSEAQYSEMFGVVLAPAEGAHPGVAPQGRPPEGKHIAAPREPLPPIVTFQLIPKGGVAQQAGAPQPQPSCPPAVTGPLPSMYQLPEMARLPGMAFPAAVLPPQDGQAAQTVLPAYHPFPASVGKYPTPPSQHSYTSSSAAERTPSLSGHLQGEHPYLTPSPESPDQWSSSSPHSASDWSDVTTSPTPGGATGGPRGPGAHMSEPPRSNMQVYA